MIVDAHLRCLCGRWLTQLPWEAGGAVRCPDCGAEVTVPIPVAVPDPKDAP